MDSITQAILGASIGEFLGGKKYGRKAALIGAIVATIPDLDVFIGPLLYSDPIQAELFHRSVTHSLLFSIVAAPLIGWAVSHIFSWFTKKKEGGKEKKIDWRNWTIISFWTLATHRMLDLLTGYGTKWLRPFSDVPYAVDSVFIVDPFYTAPFLVLLMIGLAYKKHSRTRRVFNGTALTISTLYLLWGMGVKLYAQQVFIGQLERQAIIYEKMYTSAEPLTTLLRRGRAEDETNRYIGRWSLFDTDRKVQRKSHAKNHELIIPYIDDVNVQKVLARRKYNVIAKPIPNGVAIVPIQFGDLLGRTGTGESFMFSYEVTEQDGRIHVQQSGRGAGLPEGMFGILRERVKGIE